MTKIQFVSLTSGMYLMMRILLIILVSKNLSGRQLGDKFESYEDLIADWYNSVTRVKDMI